MVQEAERIRTLPGYLFAELDKKVREAKDKGMDVIKLGIGDPDMPTPSFIINRMKKEVEVKGNHQYPPDEGVKEYREAVAAYYKERHNVTLDPTGEILPLIGSKEGIARAAFAFTDPGNINLIPDPGYPVYGIATSFAGGKSYNMPLEEKNDFFPDLTKIPEDVANNARILFLNYPNNPTGAVADKEFFAEAVSFAKKYNLVICHDAAYSEIAFDDYKPLSILEVDGAKEIALEFNSLSKPFNMTGWRIGHAVGCPEAVKALYRFKTNVDSGIFNAVQYAGVEALTNPEREGFLASVRKTYQERRDVVVKALEEAGWPSLNPKATFYIWAPVPKGYTSKEFAAFLLEKTGVVVTPGRGFGEYGEGYFRIALTVDVDRMQEAMDRFKEAVSFQ